MCVYVSIFENLGCKEDKENIKEKLWKHEMFFEGRRKCTTASIIINCLLDLLVPPVSCYIDRCLGAVWNEEAWAPLFYLGKYL